MHLFKQLIQQEAPVSTSELMFGMIVSKISQFHTKMNSEKEETIQRWYIYLVDGDTSLKEVVNRNKCFTKIYI